MRILLDTSPLENGNQHRGVGRYTAELLAAMRNLHSSHQIYSTRDLVKDPIELVHYPFFDLFFPTLPLIRATPTVVTIHDVIPLVFPKHYPAGLRGTLSGIRQRLALATVKAVLTDSEVSRRDIHEHLRVPLEKIVVVALAASSSIKRQNNTQIELTRRRFRIPKNYVLYVGDINYNKNIPFLVAAMRHLPSVALVLAGKNVRNTMIPEGKAIEDMIVSHGLEKKVFRIDDLGEDSITLSSLYSGALAYIQPSFYEGFGLPILEAMQCKTPVICSRGGSLPEVAGDAAMYFHPHAEQECVDSVERVLKMTDRARLQMIERGVARAQLYTWERTARETIAVYESLH